MHGHPLVRDEEFLAKSKHVEDLDEAIQEATEAVTHMILMDKYAEFIVAMPEYQFGQLDEKEMRIVTRTFTVAQFSFRPWPLNRLLMAFSTVVWRKFAKTMEKEASHLQVLGVTKKHYFQMREIVRTKRVAAQA